MPLQCGLRVAEEGRPKTAAALRTKPQCEHQSRTVLREVPNWNAFRESCFLVRGRFAGRPPSFLERCHKAQNHSGLGSEIVLSGDKVGAIAGKFGCRDRHGEPLKYQYRDWA